VRLFTPIAVASETGLLEQGAGPAAACRDGAATVTMPERGTLTLAVRLAGPAAPAGQGSRAAVTGVAPEPAQPVFTRYWLHGKGPAPAGNLPVAVHLTPGLLALRPGDSGTLGLTVACVARPASGTVTVDVPAGLAVLASQDQPGGRPRGAGTGHAADGHGTVVDGPGLAELPYHLSPGGFAAWELAVRVRPEATAASHFVTARILDEAGQLLEDAAVVAVGSQGPPPPDLPLAELAARIEMLGEAEAAESELVTVTGDLELPPGGHGVLAVRLRNLAASALRGEAQLISPSVSWPAVASWTTGFAAEPGAVAELAFDVTVPRDARPGERWWALVKVMYFGRLRYSETVWVSVI
jgi:hypothetical protein